MISMPLVRKFLLHTHRVAAAMAVLHLLLLTHAEARADLPEIMFTEKWSTVFGGERVQFHVESAVPVQLTWSLAHGDRTISRGEKVGSGKLEIEITAPPVKDGVVLPLILEVTAVSNRDGDNKATGQAVKNIWVYPRNPFALETASLTKANIQLYDPVGDTASLFEEFEIPHKKTTQLSTSPANQPVTLVVGSGLSLAQHRTVFPSLQRIAAAGHKVLLLAPTEGNITLSDGETPQPTALHLSQSEIIAQLDKRLDAHFWPADKPQQLGFKFESVRNQPTLIVEEGAPWSWLEMNYAQTGGRIIVSSFGIIEQWSSGPTPRFLLARILSYLINSPDQEK